MCVAEGARSGDCSQIGLNRGSPYLQLASSSSVPRARRCGKEKVLDLLTFGTSYGMTKPAEPSLHEQCWYACKAEDGTQSLRLMRRMPQTCGPKRGSKPALIVVSEFVSNSVVMWSAPPLSNGKYCANRCLLLAWLTLTTFSLRLSYQSGISFVLYGFSVCIVRIAFTIPVLGWPSFCLAFPYNSSRVLLRELNLSIL